METKTETTQVLPVTYLEVCAAQGIDPVASLPFPSPVSKKQVSVNGAFKLETIFEEYNKTAGPDGTPWEPDYTNYNQLKHYPWHDYNPAVGGFVCTRTNYTDTLTILGARLCTNTSEKAKSIGKNFNAEWNEFLNPQI